MARKVRRNVILASYATEIAMKQGRARAARAVGFVRAADRRRPYGRQPRGAPVDADERLGMAGGLLSGLTGNRGALGVLDDPIAGRAEAESETIRKRTWEAYVDDFCSRLIPGAPQSPDPDALARGRRRGPYPAGRLGRRVRMDRWPRRPSLVRHLPAGDRRSSRRSTRPADRRDVVAGMVQPGALGAVQEEPAHWSSLYQQKPAPAEGTFFQRGWFRRYRPGSLPTKLNYYITSDHAPAGQSTSDFACVRVWGVDSLSNVYLVDGFRKQITMDKLTAEVVGNVEAAKRREVDSVDRRTGLVRKYRPFAWFPEDDNNWKSVAGFVTAAMRMEKQFVRIEPITPHGADKQVKAQAFQGLAASGCVWIPEGPEGDDVIEQYVKFPSGKNDDEVDAGSLIGRAIADAHPAVVPVKTDEAGGSLGPRVQQERQRGGGVMENRMTAAPVAIVDIDVQEYRVPDVSVLPPLRRSRGHDVRRAAALRARSRLLRREAMDARRPRCSRNAGSPR